MWSRRLLLILATTAALPAAAAELTAAEVARHDQAGDCWMIIDGMVYDLTGWIEAHPGGDAILRGCGKDASWFFHNRDLAGGHSDAAAALLEGYAIGALGASVALSAHTPREVHPHDVRLEGARAGILPTSGVGPKNSIAFRVAHNFAQESDILSQVGYSFGWGDVMLSDARGIGLGGLEVRVRPLQAHRNAPLSVTLLGGGGFASELDAPVFYGQLVAEADALGRRLMLRGVGTASGGGDDGLGTAAGAGVEFRPIPIHGVFAELNVPLAEPDGLAWSAGARLYTRRHAFSIYAASMVSASPWSLAGASDGFAVGAAMERAFQLGR